MNNYIACLPLHSMNLEARNFKQGVKRGHLNMQQATAVQQVATSKQSKETRQNLDYLMMMDI